jgi:hypothetical protein
MRRCRGGVADKTAADGKEGFVDVGPVGLAAQQPLELVGPGEGAFDDPAEAAEAGAAQCCAERSRPRCRAGGVGGDGG